VENSSKSSELEVRVAEHFSVVGRLIQAFLRKVWATIHPYLLPGAVLLLAGFVVGLMTQLPVSLDTQATCLSILAGALILSATMLLIAGWILRRKG
jgi:CHASE2 domain-containing sensor protein